MTAADAVQVQVRRAAAGDRGAVLAMFERCTPATRYRRFHGCVRVFPRRYLDEALSGSPVHYALVGCADGGAVVALASCRVVEEGLAEVAILVEDAWQRRGLGTALLDELVAGARRLGLRALTAQLLAEERWAAGLLRRHGTGLASRVSCGTLTLTVRLDAAQLSCRSAAARSASA